MKFTIAPKTLPHTSKQLSLIDRQNTQGFELSSLIATYSHFEPKQQLHSKPHTWDGMRNPKKLYWQYVQPQLQSVSRFEWRLLATSAGDISASHKKWVHDNAESQTEPIGMITTTLIDLIVYIHCCT